MKTLLLLCVLGCSVLGAAEKRDWRDATVKRIEFTQQRGGYASVPIGTSIVYAPIQRNYIYYWIETKEVTFILGTVNKKPLNLTLHGKTKVAMDGEKARILDDAGKDVKIDIVQKVARQETN